MPGLNRTHGPVRRRKSTQAEVTASRPDHPASRARCEWPAPQNPRWADFSGAVPFLGFRDPAPPHRFGAWPQPGGKAPRRHWPPYPRDAQLAHRDPAASASAARACVLRPVAATAPRPRPHDARDVPRRGRGELTIVLLGLKSRANWVVSQFDCGGPFRRNRFARGEARAEPDNCGDPAVAVLSTLPARTADAETAAAVGDILLILILGSASV